MATPTSRWISGKITTYNVSYDVMYTSEIKRLGAVEVRNSKVARGEDLSEVAERGHTAPSLYKEWAAP
ncbi:hypothetical protein Esi_0037_0077 [Ectocarpus siliculosus]|uniref:Uncharacterized protein n=1 Tax=Ectocarpus siliculosus TaxID=2880 RepID=D8LLM8_ECTSI|nr:hypothetical protein Esi_0037_0077 [Ectocarpus siliculosus]|eukprot:CBN74659.1 hypothetical protein Esi_0037_0077 [Ectocarpus siliculosus]